MPLRITINDIARACGIGKSTVARALSNHPHANAQTRLMVLAKAEEMGYRPDPGLRVLAQHRWNKPYEEGPALAVVVVGDRKMGRAWWGFRTPLDAAARKLGYHLNEFFTTDYPSLRKLGQVIEARGIRGVIFLPVVEPLHGEAFDWSRFSAVSCGIGEFRLPIHSVDISFFSAVRMCWKQCRASGYKRIGACLYRLPGPDTNDSQRHAAVLYEQSLLPRGEAKIPIFKGAIGDDAAFIDWYEKHRPDAVISLSAKAYWLLKDKGARVPEDLGYCVVDLNDGNEIGASGSMSQRGRVAEFSIHWLDQMLRTNELGLPAIADEMFIEPVWSEGRTLPPVGDAIPVAL
ncbi:MAG: LacI family DNA-binding transcriptional regulator [Opitutaceae bacterium]|nr:LacI family DNA-binding transcriptional regulator [Opitutaceae bacterium]